MKRITLTIDNQTVQVTPGATVLDAIHKAGIYIPTLCHEPYLKPYGACRLCIVQIKGLRGFPTACTTPAQPGMVVTTETEEIKRIRRMILTLVIANHPPDCLICYKSASCELLKIARFLGVEKEEVDRFRRADIVLPLDTSNPAFDFDPNKCILCGKCVRVCHEIQGLGAIDFASRGFETRISTFGARPLLESICQSCGECVQRCPTGALVPKTIYMPEAETKTICPYCGVGCSMLVATSGNRIVGVKGDIASPVSQGGLCVKGRFGLDFVHHPERLKRPLIRKEGIPKTAHLSDRADIFREADWPEALERIAAELARIRDMQGGDAIAVMSSAKCTNEENYILQKFARAVLGTNNVDHCARLCHSSTVAAAIAAFGDGAMSNSIDDIAAADALLVIGSNTTECHPIIARRIKQNVRLNGCQLIVADPRATELSELALIHLNHKPGTDVALLNGIMREILHNGLHKAAFIKNRCEDFEAFAASLERYEPEYVDAVTGVLKTKIIASAQILGKAPTMSALYGMGITQHTCGTDNVKAVANLLMLTGNMGKAGSGFSPLRGQNNVQGACDMGALPNVYPGYQPVSNPEMMAKFNQFWNAELSLQVGLPMTEMIKAMQKGDLLGLYVAGENPMMSEPDLLNAEKAIAELQFLAVQDIFLTETARMADVVLPAACFAEKDGTFTNTERRIQRLQKVVEPPGEARVDWEIIVDIANRMGYRMAYKSSAAIMEEIAQITPIYGGISHKRLSKTGGLQWPCRDAKDPGTKRLHEKAFTRGRGKFHVVHHQSPAEVPSEEYPLVLTTGRILEHFHTGSMSRRSHVLKTLAPESRINISPEDADMLGAADGDRVEVISRRGEVNTAVYKDRRVQPGMAFMAFHWNEAPANILTNDIHDPVSKIPEYKVSSIKMQIPGKK